MIISFIVVWKGTSLQKMSLINHALVSYQNQWNKSIKWMNFSRIARIFHRIDNNDWICLLSLLDSFSFLLFFISKFFAFQMCFVIIVLNHTMAHTRSNSQWLCLSLERKKYGFFVDDKFMYWISETENWILLNLMDFEMIFLPWLYRSSLERK